MNKKERKRKVEGKDIKILSKLWKIKFNRTKSFGLRGAIKFFYKINYLF